MVKRKWQNGSRSPSKGVGFIKSKKCGNTSTVSSDCPDPCFEPLSLMGMYLTGESADQCPVRILRDTVGLQSVILASLLFSDESSSGYGAVLQVMGNGFHSMPVHRVHIKSDLISVFPVAVCSAFLIRG